MNKLFFTIFITLANHAAAYPIVVQCRGPGSASDDLVYDTFFKSYVSDNGGVFDLSGDGFAQNGDYDIGNRFDGVEYNAPLTKDSRGRALSVDISGALLPEGRNIDVVLDLSEPQTKVDIEFTREDGKSVLSHLSCTTTLPQVCHTVRRCRDHCHPMAGCNTICENQQVCKPGEFAGE
ncbi:MAG: hypothetical protein AB7T49_09855 [Oligoflexales bacterium]